MGGCVVQPVSRPEEMSGLRTINPLRPTAPSGRVTGIGRRCVCVGIFPAPTCCPSQRGFVCHSRPVYFQDHTNEKEAGCRGRKRGPLRLEKQGLGWLPD